MSTGAPLVMRFEPRRVQLVRGLDQLRHAATLRDDYPATVNALKQDSEFLGTQEPYPGGHQGACRGAGHAQDVYQFGMMTGLSVHVLHPCRRYRQKHRNSGCVQVQGKVGQCPCGHQDPLLSCHLNSDSRARWAEYLGAAHRHEATASGTQARGAFRSLGRLLKHGGRQADPDGGSMAVLQYLERVAWLTLP